MFRYFVFVIALVAAQAAVQEKTVKQAMTAHKRTRKAEKFYVDPAAGHGWTQGSTGDCTGNCNGFAGDCYCDQVCVDFGDCCFNMGAQCPSVYQDACEQWPDKCTPIAAQTETTETAPVAPAAPLGCANVDSDGRLFVNSGITEIPDNAFNGCESLVEVVFEAGSSLTTIGEKAFADCNNLLFINIPQSVTSIGWRAFVPFYRNKNLVVTVQYGSYAAENAHAGPFQPYHGALVANIHVEGRPLSCNNVDAEGSVTIPADVTSIPYGTFWDCKTLKRVTFAGEQTTEIGRYAFGATNLEEITIPSSVVTIQPRAFYATNDFSVYAKENVPHSVDSQPGKLVTFFGGKQVTVVTTPNA